MANPFKLCMASAISGTLTYQGKPLANAQIIRKVTKPYRESFKTYTYQTNENGQFSVPVVYMYSFLGQFLPMEFVSNDLMYVVINDEKVNFWGVARRKPDPNIEARGGNVIIQCAAEQERDIIHVDNNMISSSCKLNVEPDPPFDWSEENLFEPAPPKRND